MSINRWWHKASGEIYWLEITGRPDIGADLKAPQRDDSGEEYWSYALVTLVSPGDIVFHYDRNAHAIVSWSRAVGVAWDEDIVWAARGTSARGTGTKPYSRPGWKLGLTDHGLIVPAVPLQSIQQRRDDVLAVEERLVAEYGGPAYMPFVRYGPSMRAQQGYLTKFPREMVGWFAPLAVAAATAVATAPTPADPAPTALDRISLHELGSEYRPANELASISARDPQSVDPALVERGTQGHARAQNQLAAALRRAGFQPRSPAPGEPNYDLAWETESDVWVAEVKSLTDSNEERQLRLGLGQVLRYRSILEGSGATVHAVLMAERKPSDPRWHALLGSLGITIVWPNLLGAGDLPAALIKPAALGLETAIRTAAQT
jgi:hypothetical protein